MLIQRYSRFIERATHSESTFGEDVSVDHCCPDIAMAEEFLDRADVVSLFQEAGSEGMPERMAASVLCDAGAQDGGLHGALEHGLVAMVAAFEA